MMMHDPRIGALWHLRAVRSLSAAAPGGACAALPVGSDRASGEQAMKKPGTIKNKRLSANAIARKKRLQAKPKRGK
jgi:hypothetical protein